MLIGALVITPFTRTKCWYNPSLQVLVTSDLHSVYPYDRLCSTVSRSFLSIEQNYLILLTLPLHHHVSFSLYTIISSLSLQITHLETHTESLQNLDPQHFESVSDPFSNQRVGGRKRNNDNERQSPENGVSIKLRLERCGDDL